jgi:hypothetical protein
MIWSKSRGITSVCTAINFLLWSSSPILSLWKCWRWHRSEANWNLSQSDSAYRKTKYAFFQWICRHLFSFVANKHHKYTYWMWINATNRFVWNISTQQTESIKTDEHDRRARPEQINLLGALSQALRDRLEGNKKSFVFLWEFCPNVRATVMFPEGNQGLEANDTLFEQWRRYWLHQCKRIDSHEFDISSIGKKDSGLAGRRSYD